MKIAIGIRNILILMSVMTFLGCDDNRNTKKMEREMIQDLRASGINVESVYLTDEYTKNRRCASVVIRDEHGAQKIFVLGEVQKRKNGSFDGVILEEIE